MAMIRLTNVLVVLTANGIDPSTPSGRNAMNDFVIERVPTCSMITYYDSEDVLEILDPYVQPPRLPELGEVQSIDYSVW